MTSATELIQALRGALAEEREAIRRLDIAAVTRANATKTELLETVRSAPSGPARDALVRAIGELREDLKRNLILLVHARGLVHDAIEQCRGPAARPARLSARL